MMSGDELYDDDVTSGILDASWPPTDPAILEREPRPCKRHDWQTGYVVSGSRTMTRAPITQCRRCGKVQDPEASRRGKASRNRGNAFEREVAAKLGGVRKGQYGDQVDVEVPGYLRVQCKNGATYPRTIDRWLRAIPVEAGLLRAVVMGDAPGPGTKRRTLIVLDLDEYAAYHGRG